MTEDTQKPLLAPIESRLCSQCGKKMILTSNAYFPAEPEWSLFLTTRIWRCRCGCQIREHLDSAWKEEEVFLRLWRKANGEEGEL